MHFNGVWKYCDVLDLLSSTTKVGLSKLSNNNLKEFANKLYNSNSKYDINKYKMKLRHLEANGVFCSENPPLECTLCIQTNISDQLNKLKVQHISTPIDKKRRMSYQHSKKKSTNNTKLSKCESNRKNHFEDGTGATATFSLNTTSYSIHQEDDSPVYEYWFAESDEVQVNDVEGDDEVETSESTDDPRIVNDIPLKLGYIIKTNPFNFSILWAQLKKIGWLWKYAPTKVNDWRRVVYSW
jgi:hypothetical protein